MTTNKNLFLRLFCLGFAGTVAVLTTTAPSCKAQEANPTHFTATGVEDEYSVQRPQTKKASVAKISAQQTPGVSTWTVAALQKEKKAPIAGRLNSITASQSSAVGTDPKHAARRVNVKKSGEPPRE